MHPDPFAEFCLGWLRRNPIDNAGREAPVVWDSGQFHHSNGKILAVLDLELGHLGDPMMDLAAWRMRDIIVGYGDMKELYARYEELSGAPVDLDATTTLLSTGIASLRVTTSKGRRPSSLSVQRRLVQIIVLAQMRKI